MSERKHVHLIGIGGSGLSAIARVLLERGYLVTGSDRSMSPMAQSLQEDGARVSFSHQAENVAGAQVVLRSSAIPDDNVEVLAAEQLGIPVVKRNEFLGSLLEGNFVIAVAGTHGKTTTTAMIAWMLTCLGEDPSYIVGGTLSNTGKNAHAGNGDTFVIEADEYDHMFLGLKPDLAVITNIEHDHPDCYPDEKDLIQAFDEFSLNVRPEGKLIVCENDRNAARLGERASQRGQKVFSYVVFDAQTHSMDLMADYAADELIDNSSGGMSWKFLSMDERKIKQKIDLQIPGIHNVQNALACMVVVDQMGLPVSQASQALASFVGTGRRFEVVGEVNGVVLIDDYAHHPTEIKATLKAAHHRYPDSRIWAVWQPHTYSRTRLLFTEFTNAFRQADYVVVTDVYAAREKQPEDGFSSEQVVRAMAHPNALYMSDFTKISEYLAGAMQPGDVLLVLSAGDADQIITRVKDLLKERSGKDE